MEFVSIQTLLKVQGVVTARFYVSSIVSGHGNFDLGIRMTTLISHAHKKIRTQCGPTLALLYLIDTLLIQPPMND